MNHTINQTWMALDHSWSLETSSKWEKDCPAKGQCGVTSLVVQDILGGEIYKTDMLGGWHFYNKIDGQFYDFTESQFNGAIIYDHIPAKREEAMAATTDNQYMILKHRVMSSLDRFSLLE